MNLWPHFKRLRQRRDESSNERGEHGSYIMNPIRIKQRQMRRCQEGKGLLHNVIMRDDDGSDTFKMTESLSQLEDKEQSYSHVACGISCS